MSRNSAHVQITLLNHAVSGDALRTLCDHTFWHNAGPEENACFRSGSIVFCKIDEVWRLFRALRRTTARIVLVTGEGDKPVTGALWAQKPRHVASWFGTNMFVDHPAAHPTPLGLGNADGTMTLSWKEIQQFPADQSARSGLLYANFGVASNPVVREPLLKWVNLPEQSWITKEEHSAIQGKAGYLNQLHGHRFVFCPPGNGEDTHRMWEALYCGAIPIVRKSPAMREFQDLPILFVEDMTLIRPEFLLEKLEGLSSRSKEKLDLDFWRQKIAAEKKSLSHRGHVSFSEFLASWFQEVRRVLKRSS